MGRVNATPPAVAPELAVVGEDLGADADAVVRALVARLQRAGRIDAAEPLVDAVLAREAIGSTALPGGLAMPHARHESVATPSVAAAVLPEALTWSEGSEPVRVVLLIAAPADDADGYLDLLQKIAGAGVKGSFLDDLLGAADGAELAALLSGAAGGR